MRGSAAAAAATVTRVAQRVVAPSAATPGGALPLSWLDRYPTQRALIESLHVFKGRADAAVAPAAAIERALAAALVSYYPIAGRLAERGDGGELVVDCTGEGVWFIEATASCSLEDVDYLEYPLMVDKDELLPHPTYPASESHPEDSLILLVQVTQFACGGFVVGFRFSHAAAPRPDGAPPPVPRHGHLHRLHRPLQGEVPGADGPPVQRVRGAHRQGVAVADARGGVRPGVPRPRVLRHERAPRAPARAPGRLLRQLLLHHAGDGGGGGGGGRVGERRGEADPGGEEAAPGGVRAVERRRRRRRGRPVPDHLRLPDAAGLRLVAAGVRRGGLRVGRPRPRRAAHQPRLHRHLHPRPPLRPQARRPPHHPVRRRRRRRRLPQRHDAPRLITERAHRPPPPTSPAQFDSFFFSFFFWVFSLLSLYARHGIHSP
ncbi:Os06g0595800 [Oryza sativa Japonica Group]|uniref:Acyl transferase 8 n=1 Tax=Oryza sativa subsp. japonica TaxID=39947 RepID=AT8_ORYSJ|nr:RecName: Full=Acyl transferase 8; Short=OsAT8 [Oryza sativa Japonica Group]BAD33029.1 0-deacetylbaccatin III-10-O-acetyl transferase-like [Oryza sativa Japonica Group]BAD33132.1 0-deacetylbaccatin III-10-O-acetyl transferase-like [Oryza sativa Japonica Group]BAF19897.1 Os06g0595800 [Oryza sativa Japonica Group]BAS98459.1 Os06g0595800 [Oryza sativa Japonica Group]|eukprot:NP_001057983.1 Os06g0595800 [Oryza sativa Japonica Group]